jgi:lipopolysaccharide export system permease protein
VSRVLNRYLFRETLGTALLVLSVLLLILVASRFSNYIGQAASGLLPKQLVFQMLGLNVLGYLSVLVPGSVFLAVLLTLGRLYRDNEMSAISACGISPLQMYRALFALGILFALGTAVLSFWIAPWAVRQSVALRNQSTEITRYGLFQAGQFHQIPAIGATFYAGATSPHGRRVYNVLIESQKRGRVDIVTARQGVFISAPHRGGNRTLILERGYRYEGHLDSARFDRIHFREYGVNLKLVPDHEPTRYSESGQTTSSLWTDPTPRNLAQLQWRFSAPLSVLILIFLALPLARTAPREGRALKIFMGILLYLLYSNLMGIGKVWVAHRVVPAAVGLWWVHVLFVLIGGVLLARLYEVHLLPARERSS